MRKEHKEANVPRAGGLSRPKLLGTVEVGTLPTAPYCQP